MPENQRYHITDTGIVSDKLVQYFDANPISENRIFYCAGREKKVILLLEPCIISIGKATKHAWASLSTPDEYVQVSLCVRASVRTDLAFVLGSAG